MEKEIWKDIIGYENLYQISSFGQVKSLNYNRTGKERVLKQGKDKDGYCQVMLCKEGERKTFKVHRLVSQVFIPNPQNLPIINHRDENPSNNCVSNLEWVTQEYNINYGTRNKRASKAISIAHKGKPNLAVSKPILQFNKSGNIILGKWESATQASKKLNIHQSNISRCCKGKYKSTGGYRWMYLQDYVNRMEKLYNLALKKVS